MLSPTRIQRLTGKKANWLSEEALQIAEKRREVKGKGEKESYKHLNAKFKEQQGEIRKPSSAINAKKQRKTIEWERLDFFKKIRDTRGTYHVKMGLIKDRNVDKGGLDKGRNGMDLTEAEDIEKRWQKYMEELYKKILMIQITMMV